MRGYLNRYQVVDTNADGRVDIVHIKGSGGAEVFLNNGQGRFTDQASLTKAAKPALSRPPIRQPPPSPFHSFFNKSSTVR